MLTTTTTDTRKPLTVKTGVRAGGVSISIGIGRGIAIGIGIGISIRG